MLYIKKYFTEGLIQVAILLSLCGVRVDVGLDPYLPLSWREMILGPTSALTPVQFHNLRNHLEDSHDLPSKTVDLDGFFTARRLLGLVRSLDRLQVPHTELETWLVQRENDPLAAGHPEQLSPVIRAPDVLEREQAPPYVSPAEEEEEQEEDKEFRDVGGEEAVEQQPSEMEPMQPCIIPTDNYSRELELRWQDVLAIMEPENTYVDTVTSSDPETKSEVLREVSSHENPAGESDQEVRYMEPPLHSGLMWPSGSSQPRPPLLPLTPTTDFEDQNSAMNARDTLKDTSGHLDPPDHMGLLAEDPLEDFSMGADATMNLHPFSMNMPLGGFVDCVESCTCPRHDRSPDSRFDFNFQSLSLRENDMSQDLLASPSSALLEDEVEDQGGLPSPLNDFLEANAILDEMSWLDGVLEEAFSAEMVTRLEEDINLDEELAQQENYPFIHSVDDGEDDHHSPGAAVSSSVEQGEPTHQQDGGDEADSDSGLSLDFSQEPHSPCVSEASSYSSSSCSSSDSSSSSLSVTQSVFSDDEEECAEDGLVTSYMEMTFKQEEQEEEMGAVGGFLEDVNKFVVPRFGDHKLFNGFPWLENVGHDHTYTQPWSTSNSPPTSKMTNKYPKSNLKHEDDRPSRTISQTKMWSRDERRARALKIPFSNDLIVNMPVEEFNELLSNYPLNEQQLTLVRDIRRRGKNKIAAQNCRKRKLGVLLRLEDEVSGLKRRRLQMLRQKQEVMKNLQEMKWQLDMLHQEVFSMLRDEQGMPLDNAQNLLQFGANGSVTVSSRQQGPRLPGTSDRPRKKQKDKKN